MKKVRCEICGRPLTIKDRVSSEDLCLGHSVASDSVTPPEGNTPASEQGQKVGQPIDNYLMEVACDFIHETMSNVDTYKGLRHSFHIWFTNNKYHQNRVKQYSQSPPSLPEAEKVNELVEQKDKEIERLGKLYRLACNDIDTIHAQKNDVLKEIERLKGLIKVQYDKRLSHLDHDAGTMNNLWQQFKTENNL